MTDLVRRIRRMTEEVGQRRGRPILVAMRLPDSVPYCRAIGLDIERWLADDLLDLLIPAGYLQLSPWETSVELGHRYGAMVYPALDESRVKEPGTADVKTGTFRTRAAATPPTGRAPPTSGARAPTACTCTTSSTHPAPSCASSARWRRSRAPSGVTS